MSRRSDDELEAPAIWMTVVDEDGEPIAFDSVHEAMRALQEYVDPRGTVSVHEKDCAGEVSCDCGVETYTISELLPKAQA